MSDDYLGSAAFFSSSSSQAVHTDFGHELYTDSGAGPSHPRTNASVHYFVGLTIFSDFCFVITFLMLCPDSLTKLVKCQSTVASVFLAVLALGALYVGKIFRIETIADFGCFLKRFQIFAVIVFVVIGGHQLVGSLWASPSSVVVPDRSIFLWYAVAVFGFICLHYILSKIFRFCVSLGYIGHSVVVVGTSKIAQHFVHSMRDNQYGVKVHALFDDNATRSARPMVSEVPVVGDVPDLLRYARHNQVDTVVIASSSLTLDQLRELTDQLSLQPLRVRLLPAIVGERSFDRRSALGPCVPFGEMPGFNLVRLVDPPIDGLEGFMKSVLDLVIGSAAIVLFAPFMLICAVGIKITSPGPILYRQKRIGYLNSEFSVFKFRTMHVSECHARHLTMRDDPRIFEFGRFMRKFSLDELPQLFNVLRGEMSLVGPRPHMPDAKAAGLFYYHAVANYAARHRVKPGITGLAQISGWRGPTETISQIENRVKHDLEYIENWSFWLDLKILVKTVFVGFFGENAF